MPIPRTPWILGGVAVAAAIAWGVHANYFSDEGPQVIDSQDRLAMAIEDLAAGQRTLQARLERLEQVQFRSGSPGFDGRERAMDRKAPANNHAPSPTAVAKSVDHAIRSNDLDFRSEPTAGAWSLEAERDIHAALDPTALSAAKIPAPFSVDASCRSRTCRIELGYLDEAASEQANAYLLQAISQVLPTALTFYKPNADGSTRMLVYARREGN